MKNNELLPLPNGIVIDTIMEVLSAGEKIANIKNKKEINHSVDYHIQSDGKQGRQIIKSTDKAEATVMMENISLIATQWSPAKKIFVILMILANQQSISNHKLIKKYVSFPLKKLLEIGLYKSLKSARTGFNAAGKILTSLKIMGYSKGNKARVISALEVLFTGWEIKNGQCIVYLNERIDWAFVIQYFTRLPQYYFSLSNRAADLLYYIFFLIPRNEQKINQNGYFTISLQAIHKRLLLPSEDGLKNPKRDIKDVLDRCIDQINSAQNDNELSIRIVSDHSARIKDYLANGKLEIKVNHPLQNNIPRCS